jgi:hypothetical protein
VLIETADAETGDAASGLATCELDGKAPSAAAFADATPGGALSEDGAPSEDEALSEDELGQLAELALSAPIDVPLDPDAVPLQLSRIVPPVQLPAWYMPAVAIRHCSGTKRAVVVSIVVALLVLEALGLCSVFGQVVIG